ncbi:TRAP transporter small permease subunit [Chthonobacter rhizosphaerae]|uniref:TRAP transporter small permease subunit n=1 Tax=Chthonobacter rhizosphaerae TaxID=2735553 RepID=UPI0015EF20E0|nr:TRAP transporter small permease subunit [Chthonobacter rhizosphaerae]
MHGLLALSRGIDRVSEIVHKTVMWLSLVAILVSAGNAFSRKFLNMSSNAWLESQWYLFSAVFLLSAAYTLLKAEHVKIDIIYGRLSRRTQVWIDILGTILFLFPFCIITVWLVWPVVVDKIATGEMSSNAGGLALWPVWILIPIGFFLLGLQGFSELIKRVAFLTGHGPDPALDQTQSHH